MKNTSVLFTGPDCIEVGQSDTEIGPLAAYELLIRTHYSLISAATELACLSGGQQWFPFPGTPGYAAVGEVVDVGASVTAVAPGDMVYNWGGHKQYHVLDTAHTRAMCMKVRDGISLPLVPFTRMITVAMTALRVSTIELGDFVAVVGLGSVGNFAAQLAGLQGGRVIGLDLSEGRVELARRCGVPHALVIDRATVSARVGEITERQGVTTLIEATGVPAALPDALPIVGRYGEVILLGTPRGVFETDLTSVLDYIHLHGFGNVTFKGAHEWRYPVASDSFVKHSIVRNSEIAMNLIRAGKLQAAPLHTHTLSPAEAPSAYHGLKHAKDEYVGVVFDWTNV